MDEAIMMNLRSTYGLNFERLAGPLMDSLASCLRNGNRALWHRCNFSMSQGSLDTLP